MKIMFTTEIATTGELRCCLRLSKSSFKGILFVKHLRLPIGGGYCVRSEVLTARNLWIVAFSVMMPCSLECGYQNF
jgi:hypothetical protein